MKSQSPIQSTEPANEPANTPASGKSAEPAAPNPVPDRYEFKSVEGSPAIDPALVERATPIFKELGLDQSQAQKLMDLQQSIAKDWASKQQKSANDLQESWRQKTLADKEVGGKIDEVKATIGRAKDQLPTDLRAEFDEVMNTTGIGDHPAFVKALYKFSQMVNEGRPVIGTGPSAHGQVANGKTAPRSLAGAMYPNLPQ